MQRVNRGRAVRIDPEMISLPKNWFTLEFFRALKKLCRGPISRTRRTMVTFKSRVPKEVFVEMVSMMKEDDVTALKWEDGVLQPTRKTGATETWEFVTKRPMVADRIFSLERGDLLGVQAKQGKGAWRRSMGCATLKLATGAKRGSQASAFSMVGGNVTVKATVPTRWRAWPTITLKFFLLTVDFRGNILWPTDWDPSAKALLAELARRKVLAFKADSSYPIREDFSESPGTTSAVATSQANPPLPPPTMTAAPLLLQ